MTLEPDVRMGLMLYLADRIESLNKVVELLGDQDNYQSVLDEIGRIDSSEWVNIDERCATVGRAVLDREWLDLLQEASNAPDAAIDVDEEQW